MVNTYLSVQTTINADRDEINIWGISENVNNALHLGKKKKNYLSQKGVKFHLFIKNPSIFIEVMDDINKPIIL